MAIKEKCRMSKNQKPGSRHDQSTPSKRDKGGQKPEVNNDFGDTIRREKKDESGTSSGGPRKK